MLYVRGIVSSSGQTLGAMGGYGQALGSAGPLAFLESRSLTARCWGRVSISPGALQLRSSAERATVECVGEQQRVQRGSLALSDSGSRAAKTEGNGRTAVNQE